MDNDVTAAQTIYVRGAAGIDNGCQHALGAIEIVPRFVVGGELGAREFRVDLRQPLGYPGRRPFCV